MYFFQAHLLKRHVLNLAITEIRAPDKALQATPKSGAPDFIMTPHRRVRGYSRSPYRSRNSSLLPCAF
jgi:hypothetical protein